MGYGVGVHCPPSCSHSSGTLKTRHDDGVHFQPPEQQPLPPGRWCCQPWLVSLNLWLWFWSVVDPVCILAFIRHRTHFNVASKIIFLNKYYCSLYPSIAYDSIDFNVLCAEGDFLFRNNKQTTTTTTTNQTNKKQRKSREGVKLYAFIAV